MHFYRPARATAPLRPSTTAAAATRDPGAQDSAPGPARSAVSHRGVERVKRRAGPAWNVTDLPAISVYRPRLKHTCRTNDRYEKNVPDVTFQYSTLLQSTSCCGAIFFYCTNVEKTNYFRQVLSIFHTDNCLHQSFPTSITHGTSAGTCKFYGTPIIFSQY